MFSKKVSVGVIAILKVARTGPEPATLARGPRGAKSSAVRRRRAATGRGANFAGVTGQRPHPGGLRLERVLLLEGARGSDAQSHVLRSHCLRDRFFRRGFERARV